METKIRKSRCKVLIHNVLILSILIALSSCDKNQNMTTSLVQTRFHMKIPLFYNKDVQKEEIVRIVYVIKVINRDKLENIIDFNNFLYEKNGNSYLRLKPVFKSNTDSLNSLDSVNIAFYSNKCFRIRYDPNKIFDYYQSGKKIIKNNELFYRYENNFCRVMKNANHNFYFMTTTEKGKYMPSSNKVYNW